MGLYGGCVVGPVEDGCVGGLVPSMSLGVVVGVGLIVVARRTEVVVGESLCSPDPSPRASACSTVRYTSTLLTGKTLCVNFRVGKGTGPSACKG